jgi:alginate O-acetyltransferase complex protein AlgI
MLFNSIAFLIFFPVVFITYYVIPPRYRTGLLLLASCYFYMSFVPQYLLILLALITIDFGLGLAIEKSTDKKKRLLYLIVSISANLGILFLFKYFNFFNENLAALAHIINWNYSPLLFSIVLPLGLSFHVFQSLSYVIEVYKGKYKAERNYWTYALYVLFFPQLVAGPIERPQNLLPQLNTVQTFDDTRVRQGLEQMLWGFFKKVVIADQIAQMINPLYQHLPTESSLLFAIAILFSYQLYCDFSGYSDIALGSAKMLGYDLQINFNRPYAARSLSDFWRRWHISLSNWLRDYLYYPLALGWGRKTKAKLYLSLIVTFALIGLWHGAAWTFVVFGLVHGVYLALELATERPRRKIRMALGVSDTNRLHHALQTLVVFIAASVSFVFFRSTSLSQAWWFIGHLFAWPSLPFVAHGLIATLAAPVGNIVFVVVVASIVIMEIMQYYQTKAGTLFIFDAKPRAVRYTWYYTLATCILLFGYFGGESFIYFQF